MPRTCTVCSHPERQAIEAAIHAGTSYRTIADRYHVSKTALLRHKADHLSTPVIPHIPAHATQATSAMAPTSPTCRVTGGTHQYAQLHTPDGRRVCVHCYAPQEARIP